MLQSKTLFLLRRNTTIHNKMRIRLKQTSSTGTSVEQHPKIEKAMPPPSLAHRMLTWQVHSFGEDLQLTNVRLPHITAPTDVLVKVEASSINPIDYMMKGN